MIAPVSFLLFRIRGLFFALSILANFSYAQGNDSTKVVSHFSGAVSVTQNGISLIPTFSLGKPAAIFDMSVGRKLSFEPQFRFSLEGKPWSFLFWWRYRLVKEDRFSLGLGAHPALAFRTVKTATNGGPEESIVTHRYLAAELTPNYAIAKNTTIGFYYLYSHGFEKEAVQNTHFLTFNTNFSHIRLPGKFFMKLTPQIYYLKLDKQDGFYFTSTVTLAREHCPISVSNIVNKVIQTEITVSKDFVWNATLTYSFGKKYVEL